MLSEVQWDVATLVAIATYCSVELYKRVARRYALPPATTAVVRDLVAVLLGGGLTMLQGGEPLKLVIAWVIYTGLGAMAGTGINSLGHFVKGTDSGLVRLERMNRMTEGLFGGCTTPVVDLLERERDKLEAAQSDAEELQPVPDTEVPPVDPT